MKFKNIKVGESYEIKDNIDFYLVYTPGDIVVVKSVVGRHNIYVHQPGDGRNQCVNSKNLRKLKEKK